MQTEAWLITKWDAELIRQRRWAARLIEATNSFGVLLRIYSTKEFSLIARSAEPENLFLDKPEYTKPLFCMAGLLTTMDDYFTWALIRQLRAQGIWLPNGAYASQLATDKFFTYQCLANHNLPIPKTLLLRTTVGLEPNDFSPLGVNCDYILESLKLPIVVKVVSGTAGKGIILCKTVAELQDVVDMLQTVKTVTPVLVQAYIECENRDIRIWLIGGKAYTAVQRSAKPGSFKSNLIAGGTARSFPLTPELCDLAERAAQLIGLTDYGSVDVLPAADGYKICEVQSYPNFKGAEEQGNTKIAEPKIKHFIEQARRNKI